VKRILALVAVFLLTRTAAAANPPSCDHVLGTWHNQIGSTLQIDKVDHAGIVTGSYTSPKGTDGKPLPLAGWLNTGAGDKDVVAFVIAFSVRWGAIGTVTSWTGTCAMSEETNLPTITTLWHLARPSTSWSFDHIVSGSDWFTPGPPLAPKAAAKPSAVKK
jgi:hypothetical protein